MRHDKDEAKNAAIKALKDFTKKIKNGEIEICEIYQTFGIEEKPSFGASREFEHSGVDTVNISYKVTK
jgi:hypothetical protein